MQQLAAYALVFVVVGMILSFGALIMTSTGQQVGTVIGCNYSLPSTNWCGNASNNQAYTAITNSLTGLTTFGTWMPILAIVIVAGIVIVLLLGSFALRTGA